MKIEITKVIKEEINVTLPVFRKNNCHFYKVFSDEKCIQICNLDGNIAIGIHHSGLAYAGTDTIDCSKNEFEDSLNAIRKKLSFIASDKYELEALIDASKTGQQP